MAKARRDCELKIMIPDGWKLEHKDKDVNLEYKNYSVVKFKVDKNGSWIKTLKRTVNETWKQFDSDAFMSEYRQKLVVNNNQVKLVDNPDAETDAYAIQNGLFSMVTQFETQDVMTRVS